MFCGREDVSKAEVLEAIKRRKVLLCGRCRKELAPTALDQVLVACGMSDQQFSDLTGIPVRTIARASKGLRLSKRLALRLAKITGLPWQRFRPDDKSDLVSITIDDPQASRPA